MRFLMSKNSLWARKRTCWGFSSQLFCCTIDVKDGVSTPLFILLCPESANGMEATLRGRYGVNILDQRYPCKRRGLGIPTKKAPP